MAKVRAFGWAPPTDAGAAPNSAAAQRIREHLEAASFVAALQRCYSTSTPSVPADITIFLSFDGAGRVARSVLEGVPTSAAPCVNPLFGGLALPGLAGEATAEGGTVSGVVDVQAL